MHPNHTRFSYKKTQTFRKNRIYSFTVSDPVNGSGVDKNGSPVTTLPTLKSTLWSICLSPTGNLSTTAPATYNYETYAEANPGINPGGWAQGSGPQAGQLWGIQNANYLWQRFGTSVQSPKDPVAAAALALAMYDVLWNSSGYGTVAAGNVKTFSLNANVNPAINALYGFTPVAGSSQITGTELQDYENDLAALTSYTGSTLAPGYVFVPTSPAAGGPTGQEFIILAPTPGPKGNPVPEPTTIVAGALLLLPFGASALRNLRKKITP